MTVRGRPLRAHGPDPLTPITPIHVCLEAKSREDVDAFHRAALAAGGKDFGAPGLRPHYHASY